MQNHNNSRLYSAREELFGLDIRSLALFRISLGCLILFDIVSRFSNIQAHYTDTGILPREVIGHSLNPAFWSLHMVSGNVVFQAILFLIAMICALMLILGYRTHLATILSWLLLASLHNRNLHLNNSGDIYFRILLFWAMFLPLGTCFSCDQFSNKSKNKPPQVIVSGGSIALIFQICFLYWFAAILKNHPVWYKSYDALYFALNFEFWVRSFGLYLINFPYLLKLLTFLTVILEIAGPALLFIPSKTYNFRLLIISCFLAFHLIGIALIFDFGIFTYVCSAAWLALLPSYFWDHIAVKIRIPLFHKYYQKISQGTQKILKPLINTSASNKSFATSRFMSILALCFLSIVFIQNISTLDKKNRSNVIIKTVKNISRSFQIYQYWTMYAPHPGTSDGWYVSEALLANGKIIDIINNGQPVSWDRPVLISKTFKNQRWRRYLTNIRTKKYRRYRKYYGNYLIHSWNAHHPDSQKIISLSIFFMSELTLYEEEGPKKEKIWSSS